MSGAPYAEGRDAFQAGLTPQQCPYQLASDAAEAWLRGWYDAKAGSAA